MPVPVLRLLLCAVLLLNGFGAALASTHVALMACGEHVTDPAPPSTHDTGPAAADCPHARAPGGPPDADPADGSCLALCMDICLQPPPALPAPQRLAALTLRHPPAGTVPVVGMPNARLHPPLRPPISG